MTRTTRRRSRPRRRQDASDMTAFRSAPSFIRHTIAYPYINGPQFAYTLFLQNQDFTAVNAAFERIPESTEQVIHPEKYAESEQPLNVDMPDLAKALGVGWTETHRDVMGELFIRSLLSDRLEPEAYEAAAAGWGGDSLPAAGSSERQRRVRFGRLVGHRGGRG